MKQETIVSMQSVRGKFATLGQIPSVAAVEIKVVKTHLTPNIEQDGSIGSPAYNSEEEVYYILASICDGFKNFSLSKKSYYKSILFEFDETEPDAAEFDDKAECIETIDVDEGEFPDFAKYEYAKYYELSNYLVDKLWNDQQ